MNNLLLAGLLKVLKNVRQKLGLISNFFNDNVVMIIEPEDLSDFLEDLHQYTESEHLIHDNQ